MRFVFVAVGLGLASFSTVSIGQDSAKPRFTPERIRAHVNFLADDLLEGRRADQRGYHLAARYVATQFAAMGLKPAVSGNWYQEVPLQSATLTGAPATLTIGGKTFPNLTRVLIPPKGSEADQRISAPVVFVGYGLDMPARGFDDYAGLDVRGKVVAVISGFPKGTSGELGAHLNREKAVMAQKRGAIGVLTIRSLVDQKRLTWARAVESARDPAVTWVEVDGKPHQRAPGIVLDATLDTPAADALFAGSGRTVAEILTEADAPGARPMGFALKPAVTLERHSKAITVTSHNVLAILPGSDPALAGEYVVLTAHLDHKGMDPTRTGDTIFNGAMDNAMGIATMLEVARAMTESPRRQRRPILFAAVTAEEFGLLGSTYLARHPVVGNGKVVGVVNVDMPVVLEDFSDIIAFGAERSTLGPVAKRAAAGMDIAVSPDPEPQEGRFTRSDHYSFVREGVPALSVKTGFAGKNATAIPNFNANHYHRPSDQADLPINWDAAAKFARINHLIVREIADAGQRPLWYESDFFGDTFAPRDQKAPAPPK